ncbi:MAG: caspase family protein [Proteobacteria bacterium]|nr:caspase family protein [Pseudomonadota bacterium]
MLAPPCRLPGLARALAVGALVLALAAPPALAQSPGTASDRRVALVIGNGAYQAGGALANPVNDARAMSAKLKKLGFDVVALENGTQKQMQRAIGQFSAKLGADAISLFYYAGHGMQVNGRNYLMPVDAEITVEQTVRLEAVDVDAVIDQMSMAKSRVNLVILDACRNNPFERRFRSVAGGLASIEAPTGTLIAYATSPGKVAADGSGDNGLYTAELLTAMDAPGAKVEDVFKRTRANVVAKSAGNQTPWESSSLTGDFYFAGQGAAVTPATAATAPSADREIVLWTSVKDSRNPALLQTYLDQFPQGTFAGTARVMIDELKRGQVAAAPAKPDVAATRPAVVAPAAAPSAVAPPRGLSERGMPDFEKFQKAKTHKAFAMATNGRFGAAWSRETPFSGMLGAIWHCNRAAKAPCRAYMVDDTVVEPEYAAFDAASETAMSKVRAASLASPPYAEEERDFGIPRTSEIRQGKYHAETPRSMDRAKTITTVELVALLKGASPPVLIDVLDANERHNTLPTSWWWRAAGIHGLEQEAALTELMQALLAGAVPKRDTAIVFFCLSSRCWLSHNAALRAIGAGYTNVYWYRGGIEAWRAANLPLVKAVVTAQLIDAAPAAASANRPAR